MDVDNPVKLGNNWRECVGPKSTFDNEMNVESFFSHVRTN